MEQITLKEEVKWSKSHLRRETGQTVLLVKMLDCSKGGCEGDAADEATIIDYSKTGANKR